MTEAESPRSGFFTGPPTASCRSGTRAAAGGPLGQPPRRNEGVALHGLDMAGGGRGGSVGHLGGVEVVVPATVGLENGVWFKIRQGIRGVLVHDEAGEAVVYLLVEPA